MNIKDLRTGFATVSDFMSALFQNVAAVCKKNKEFQYFNPKYFPASVTRMALPPSSCNYRGRSMWDKSTPAGPECCGCVFGQALRLMGWSDEKEMSSGRRINDLISDAGQLTHEEFTENQMLLVTALRIQRARYSGNKWGSLVSMIQ